MIAMTEIHYLLGAKYWVELDVVKDVNHEKLSGTRDACSALLLEDEKVQNS